MGISTIGRTLEGIDAFERLETEFFSDISSRASEPGTALLASWLAGRKRHSDSVLGGYRPGEAEVIRRSPIFEERFGSDAEGWFAERRLGDGAPAEALLDVAIECGRLLLDCARHIAEQRLDRGILAFAGSFEAIALREVKELKKIKALGYF